MIEWEDRTVRCNYTAHRGFTKECDRRNDEFKYFVGRDKGRLIVDVTDQMTGSWRNIDIPVESVEHGKRICEMWEATGAY